MADLTLRVLGCVQLRVAHEARCEQLASVSRGMLRLLLMAGSPRLTLDLRQVRAGMLGFWGAVLGDAADLRLEILHAQASRGLYFSYVLPSVLPSKRDFTITSGHRAILRLQHYSS